MPDLTHTQWMGGMRMCVLPKSGFILENKKYKYIGDGVYRQRHGERWRIMFAGNFVEGVKGYSVMLAVDLGASPDKAIIYKMMHGDNEGPGVTVFDPIRPAIEVKMPLLLTETKTKKGLDMYHELEKQLEELAAKNLTIAKLDGSY